MVHLRANVLLFLLSLVPGIASAGSDPSVIIGRPTDHSATLNVLSQSAVDAYVEYGVALAQHTPIVSLQPGTPQEIPLENLEPDSGIDYRLRWRPSGAADFVAGDEHAFHTQRPRGSTFTFAIQADPHLDPNTSPELLARSLGNVLDRHPDFLIDLGDTFMSEKLAPERDAALARYRFLRGYFDLVGHSVPLFLVQGNHDGEAGWLNDGTVNNLAVWTTTDRKQFFPGPRPDAFYSGDSTVYPHVGVREAVYAFEWGDALFVVLDPFWNTTSRGTGHWSWTVGRDQYLWLDSVLRNSHATFKFVFIHHLVGGVDNSARGGIEAAPLYEWGGRNADGTYQFDSQRPGWGKPIHQLLVETGVTAVFHGHDHLYAKESLDGVVYQEVPQPGWPGLTLADPSKSGYLHGEFFPSSGDLLVTVAPDHVNVEYIRAILPKEETTGRMNGETVTSYTIDGPQIPARRRAVRR